MLKKFSFGKINFTTLQKILFTINSLAEADFSFSIQFRFY